MEKFSNNTEMYQVRHKKFHLLIPHRALQRSWAQSLSVSLISLIIGKSLHSASMTFPEFQWADQLLIREGRGWESREKQIVKQSNLGGTSLVVQWSRTHLPMQGTRVWALVWEDPTCHRATKPVSHNYWACEPQLLSPHATTTEACAPRTRAPQQQKPPQWEAHAPQWRVAPTCRN